MISTVELIEKKKKGKSLEDEEIEYIVKGFLSGQVAAEQMAAFLMAVWFNGLDLKETACLTGTMTVSGKQIDLASISGTKIDKHSTGGIGDKISIILAPLMAACGFKILKMSGRALGHTGGTIDKLESIPGFNTGIRIDEALRQTEDIGLCLIAASDELNPADKIIYNLRDKTGTVDSIPLIAASVVSKKIAGGADQILLDVKCGDGAFINKIEKAKELAVIMTELLKAKGRESAAYITAMDTCLGRNAGNFIEMKEAAEALKGNMAEDVEQLVMGFGRWYLLHNRRVKDEKEAEVYLRKQIVSGNALKKLKMMIEAQGGDYGVLENPPAGFTAKVRSEIFSPGEGFIGRWPGTEIGKALALIGAGRMGKNDKIKPFTGITFYKKKGEKVEKGEPLALIQAESVDELDQADSVLTNSLEIVTEEPMAEPVILEIID